MTTSLPSVHDLVSAHDVAAHAGVSSDVAEAVLAAQRRTVAGCLATNWILLLPEVTLYHRGDALGQWCEGDGLQRVKELTDSDRDEIDAILEQDESLNEGTIILGQMGCPDELLAGREAATIDDVEVLLPAYLDGIDISPEDLSRTLDSFWALVTDLELQWRWPYDRIATERAIEDWLTDNLAELEAFGLHVDLLHEGDRAVGRQWRSLSGADRLDLLVEVVQDSVLKCESDGEELELDFPSGALLIIELKAVPAHADHLAQLDRYTAAVEAELADGRPVMGLLIAPGTTGSFESEFATGRHGFLLLSQLGFLQTLMDPRFLGR